MTTTLHTATDQDGDKLAVERWDNDRTIVRVTARRGASTELAVEVAAGDALPHAEAVLGEPVLTRTQLSALLGSDDRDVMTNADLREHVAREVVVRREELPPYNAAGLRPSRSAAKAREDAAAYRTEALRSLAVAAYFHREADRLADKEAQAAREARLDRGRHAYTAWGRSIPGSLPAWPALDADDRERWAAVADAVAELVTDVPF